MEKKQHHEVLRKFFTISNGAFEFQRLIVTTFGHTKPFQEVSAMQMLHKLALQELEKPEPNDAFLDGLLFQMEKLAEQNAQSGEEKI